MFRFRCSKCGQTTENPEDLTGKPCPSCGAVIGDSESALHLSPGDKVGGYEIIRLLGSGGTGNVYLALQLSMSRQIALKVLYPELTEDEASVNQFLGEIRTLGIIQHANIVSAFDSGMDKERRLYFLAMQYIPGQPLDTVVTRSGPLSIPKALQIVECIAEALNYVWTKYQFCHRDIKPGNIILNEDDVPMLLDFGAVLHSNENSISNGLVEGSPHFMSPEQARGEKLTFASDLYSLGETLYYLIVGVVPFDDPDVREVLKKQCEAPFPQPAQRNPESNIPQEVVSLLRKAMAKSPVDRFESWEEFLAELKKVKKSLAGKNAGAKGAVRSSGKSIPKTAAAKASSLNKLNAAPVKKKGRVIAAFCYILITLLTAGALLFMFSRRNTQSAENRMIEVRAAMKNVLENDKDPAGAKEKIRKALAEIRKFGVSKEVYQEISKECAEELRSIESLEEENRQVEQIQLTISTLISESSAAQTALRWNVNEETLAELKRIQSELTEQSTKISNFTCTRPSNKEKLRQASSAIDSQMQTIAEQLNTASSASEKAAESAAGKKAAAAAKKKAAQEARRKREQEEKNRRIERYRRNVEREKERIARDIVLELRKGNPDQVEQILASGSGLKVPDPSCRDTETAYNAWLAKIRELYLETKSILRGVPPDEVNKKEKIYSLIGGNRALLCHSLLLFGYFSEAQKLALPEEQALLRDISVAYLTPRIERAIINARNGDDQELVDLRQEYEKFELYTEIENTVRARMFGGK